MYSKGYNTILPFAVIIAAGFLLLAHPDRSAAQNNVVDIHNIGHRNWKMETFSIERKLDLHVEARGAEAHWKDFMYAYAWILDARSRDVVWEMNLDNTSRRRRERELEYEGTITLPAGDYEVYFAISPFIEGVQIEGLGDLLEGIFHGFKDKRYSRDWGITIDVENEKDMRYVHDFDSVQDDQSSIIEMIRMGDDEFRKEGFSLKSPTTVRIYAIGEGSRSEREMYDYGWIIDTSTRGRIWEMTARNSHHAGGVEKNLLHDDTIDLPPGDYMIYYVTDGSHSYDRWNARPPYDPTYWGITLWAINRDFSPQDVVPYLESREQKPIIELTRMRDDEFESQGFSLRRATKLHIYALGEYTSDRFYDYGIILDAHTREKVWSMTRYNTDHAGGGKKNRLFDGVVEFPAGDYIVYYITDGSHSYHDWNTGPPYDPESWGITISVAEKDFNEEEVLEYREREDPDILVNITGLGNHERQRERFHLSSDSKVRIYAIGEGDRDDMYDYGWIENERGRVVWEMSYRNTEHAGGARKNRLFNDTVLLEEGEYKVEYRTDGSHSFEKWNSNPPNDPFHWGVSQIFRIKGINPKRAKIAHITDEYATALETYLKFPSTFSLLH